MKRSMVNKPSVRLGPFGPAKDLLPKGQETVQIAEDSRVSEALRIMIENGFSQLPVVDKRKHVVGILSFRSVSKRVLELHPSLDVAELYVAECLEPATFLPANDYIDTTRAADFRQVDYVLVGTPTKVAGILSVADVFARLNDFAEAFVLLSEIESGLRRLIAAAFGPKKLKNALEEINRTNARRGAVRPIKSIEDSGFADYAQLIASRSNWQRFQKFFPHSQRELVSKELDNARKLRNDVFHFRRQITRADTTILRGFRDKVYVALGLPH
jgi:CBS domain-containing protein